MLSYELDILVTREAAGEFLGAFVRQPPRSVHDSGKIDPHVGHVYAEDVPVSRVCSEPGGRNHRLAGRTAEIHARTAEMLAFEQHNRSACVCQGPGEGHSSLADTDNGSLRFDGFHGDEQTKRARVWFSA
jgi:hypothetical protein